MSDEVKIPLPGSLQEIVGALLFASETPLTAAELRESIKSVSAAEGEDAEIMDVYRTCTSKAYRIQTVPSCGRYVRAMLRLDRPNRLGRASLEALAIIAYRQPLTKSEIEDIRGVDVTANLKTLMDLQLIRLVGRSELPGHPFLYGTTPLFLEHFGLSSLQQLNEIDPTLQRSNPRQKAEQYRKAKADDKPVEMDMNDKEEDNDDKAQDQQPDADGGDAAADAGADDPDGV